MNRQIYSPNTLIPLPLAKMSGNPLVSVLIANFNYEIFIGKALESALSQEYPRLEIIVVDDGSSDRSLEIIRSFSDPRIRLFVKENGGQASAINKAFRESRGEIIAILDADDIFMDRKIPKIVEAFRNAEDRGFLIHNLLIVDEHGATTGRSRFKLDGYLGNEIPTLRLGLPIPQASGLCFRREVLDRLMPIPENEFRSVADWALGYGAAFLTKTILIPEYLSKYRIHSHNMSGTTKTSPRLSESSVEKTLKGMEKVLINTNRIVQSNFRQSIPVQYVRNYVEHRILYAILVADRNLRAESFASLKDAFRSARRDYPFSRYLFWKSLCSMPPKISRVILRNIFSLYRFFRTSIFYRVLKNRAI